MKLLLFSDLHTDIAAAKRLVEVARDVDVVVGAGDFANARQNVFACISVLSAIKLPAVLVPGNNESYEELSAACVGWPSAKVLHGAGVVVREVPFFGIGGGVPVTPFGNWSYDFSEAEAERMLRDCPSKAVLVSHSPPKGVADRSSAGQSLGSTAVLDVINRRQPRLVVCGHIHASAGECVKVGTTMVINAGPRGILLDLPNS